MIRSKPLFCLLLCCIFSRLSIAQTVLFQNSFDTVVPGWTDYSTADLSNTTVNGKYILSNKGSFGYILKSVSVPGDYTRNFSIETSVAHVSGDATYPYGLTFGGKDFNNLYFFGISNTGFFTIGAYVQAVVKTIVPWTASPLISRINGAYSKLTVERSGDKLLFLINGAKVAENPMVDFFGDQTGLMVQKVQSVAFDYLNVSYTQAPVQQVMKTAPVDNNTGKTAYYTGFDADDANQWVLPNMDSAKTVLEDGKFKILRRATTGSTGSVSAPETWVDMSRDFLVETEAVHYDGTDQMAYGLSFGSDSTQAYYFSLAAAGAYSLGYIGGQKYTDLVPWTRTDDVSKGNMVKNKMTVVNKGGVLSLYVNDHFLKSIPTPAFSGHQFGVQVTSAQSVAYDYLSFKYLDNKISINPYERLIAKPANDVMPPVVTVTSPQVMTRGLKVVENSEVLKVAGIAKDPSGIFSVVVNGVQAKFDEQGNFWANVPLAIGDNPLMIEATDMKMNKETYRFTVSKPAAAVAEKTVTNAPGGRFYALIIGVQDYQDETINDLDEPVADATSLYNILKQAYTFNEEDMKLLKNPTRQQFFDELDVLSKKVKEDDNLLIFYAGHGYWDEVKKQGYWFPSDAKRTSRASWLTNADIKEYISSIPSKHTLLITDACFAGSIFKTRGIDMAGADRAVSELYGLPSRKAMTSGTLKEVPDKSVFIEYLVKRLTQNTEKYLSTEQLYASFRTAVINNSANGQVPQFGEIGEAGDEGGDFIFIKK